MCRPKEGIGSARDVHEEGGEGPRNWLMSLVWRPAPLEELEAQMSLSRQRPS